MKIVACSQARLDSTRLPGKVLLQVGRKSLLDYHISRVAQATKLVEHVIATSENENDNKIVAFCEQRGVRVIRGSKDNVLLRFNAVADELALDNEDRIIRLTADCPLVDGKLIDELVSSHLAQGDDYTSLNTGNLIRGFDAEIMSVAALRYAAKQAIKDYEREHVTPYIYQHPELFKCGHFKALTNISSAARLCIDEPADFTMFEALVATYPDDLLCASSQDIMAFLALHPAIAQLNLHVHQKRLGE